MRGVIRGRRHLAPHGERDNRRAQAGDRPGNLVRKARPPQHAADPCRRDRGEERLDVEPDHDGRPGVIGDGGAHRSARDAAVRGLVARDRRDHVPQHSTLHLLEARLGHGDQSHAAAFGQGPPAVVVQRRAAHPPRPPVHVGEPGELALVDVEQAGQRPEIGNRIGERGRRRRRRRRRKPTQERFQPATARRLGMYSKDGRDQIVRPGRDEDRPRPDREPDAHRLRVPRPGQQRIGGVIGTDHVRRSGAAIPCRARRPLRRAQFPGVRCDAVLYVMTTGLPRSDRVVPTVPPPPLLMAAP